MESAYEIKDAKGPKSNQTQGLVGEEAAKQS